MVFNKEMTAVFKMSDLGLLHYYLEITLSQGAYTLKNLERSSMMGCNPWKAPRSKLSKYSVQPLVDAMTYRSIIENLRYLVNTLPILAFLDGFVSHFSVEPREDHFARVKRILRNVVGTSN